MLYVEDLINKGYCTRDIRFFLIYSQYRKRMNFTFNKIKRSSKKLNDFVNMTNYLLTKNNSKESSPNVHILLDELSKSFEMHMGNDLDVKKAFDSINAIVKKLCTLKKKGKLSDKDSEILSNKLYKIDDVLQVIFVN